MAISLNGTTGAVTGIVSASSSDLSTVLDAKYTTPTDWTSFTPSWTGITVGNGTATGAYFKIGKTVMFRGKFVFGSTSAVTGAVSFATPTTLSGVNSGSYMNCVVLDSGTTYYSMFCYYGGIYGTSNATGAAQNLSSTFPITWAVNDEIHVSGIYQEA